MQTQLLPFPAYHLSKANLTHLQTDQAYQVTVTEPGSGPLVSQDHKWPGLPELGLRLTCKLVCQRC